MRAVPLLLGLTTLAGCTVGPNYHRPASTPPTTAFKAAPGWVPAMPADDRPRADWWTMFGDPTLNDLEARVAAANQNVAAAVAAYDQAQALVRENRAALFPTVGITGSATKTGGGNATTIITTGGTGGTGTSGTGTTGTGTTGTTGTGISGTTGTTGVATGGNGGRVVLGASASWVPDLFGGVRRNIESSRASASASAADLGNVLLVAQADLATNYIALRGLDAQARLYAATTAAYQRSLTITQNRYNAGVSARADLVQAQSQLKVAQANAVDLDRLRATYENAIAILVGANPSSFHIASVDWVAVAPPVPALLPSELTQRRPDVAAAERRAAAANAQIGVATAAYFPSVTLSASGNTSASGFGGLFAAGANFWSVGASVAQSVLDFGARRARVAQTRAAYAQTVAQYRQTVLTAFGDVENNLAAVDVLAREEGFRRDASIAADRAEAIALNQYKAGLVAFTDVVTLQAAALNARLTLVAAQRDREAAAVTLVQALGGGWGAPGDTTPGAPVSAQR